MTPKEFEHILDEMNRPLRDAKMMYYIDWGDPISIGHPDPCGPKGVNANDIFPYRCEKEHCSEQQIELCSKVEIEGYEISYNCLFKEKYTEKTKNKQ